VVACYFGVRFTGFAIKKISEHLNANALLVAAFLLNGSTGSLQMATMPRGNLQR